MELENKNFKIGDKVILTKRENFCPDVLDFYIEEDIKNKTIFKIIDFINEEGVKLKLVEPKIKCVRNFDNPEGIYYYKITQMQKVE